MLKLWIRFIAITTLIGSSLWAIVYPLPPHRLSKVLAKFALILGLALLLIGGYAGPALAKVTYLKEADQCSQGRQAHQDQIIMSQADASHHEP